MGNCCQSDSPPVQKEIVANMLHLNLAPEPKANKQIRNEQVAANIIEAIRTIEAREQRPVYWLDIAAELSRDDAPVEMRGTIEVLYDLFKEDRVLCDAEMNQFSLDESLQRSEAKNPDGVFELCSDRLLRLFPSYELDENCRIVPGADTPNVSFTHLKELLLSTDMERYTLLQQMTANNKCVFFDGAFDLAGERVAFQSFVRSGNTFLRRYLEQITGVFTGSSMQISHTFHEAQMGLLGQGFTSNSNQVWITKTHYPRDIPGSYAFNAQKMIVIARNPIDVFPSFANLINTHSHSLVPIDQYHVDHPEFWAQWVSVMTENCASSHRETMADVASVIPTYFMRYEDLKMNPVPVLEELFCFLLDVPSIEGTIAQRRIAEVTASGFESATAYKLKSTSTSLGRNNHMYSDKQMAAMTEELRDFISFWDYGNSSNGENGNSAKALQTNFFDVPAATADQMTFRKFNATETLAKCGQLRSSGASFEFDASQKLMNMPYRIPEKVAINAKTK